MICTEQILGTIAEHVFHGFIKSVMCLNNIPLSFHAPSIWYAEEAAPIMKFVGNV